MHTTFSLRSLMTCMTLVACHISISRVIVLNYESDHAITFRSVELAFSMLALLTILTIAAYLLVALRAPLSNFFSLSLFVVGEDSQVRAGIVNVLSIACTIAALWVLSATFLFPNQTGLFVELVYELFAFVWRCFDPQFESRLELPLFAVWCSLFAGAIWIPLFALCLFLTFRTCFAVHVSLDGNGGFKRCENLSIGNAVHAQ